VTGLVRGLDRWLFAPGPGCRVWVLRTGLAALFAVRLTVGQYHDLAGQPAVLFRPPTLWHALPQMPSAEVLVAVQALGVVLAVLAVLSWRPRATFAGAWLCFLFLEGLIASRAKISHNELLPLLAAVPVLAAPRAVGRRDVGDDPAAGWPHRAALVVVAGAYFFTGWAKLAGSGAAWVTSDNMRWILAAGGRSSKPPAPELARFVADHDLLAHGVALGAMAVELGFVLVLVWPGVRPWFFVAATALHGGIWLMLGLDYWSWVVTVGLVLLPWERSPLVTHQRSARSAIRPSSSRAQAT
jgi:hypothetical protein